MKKVTVAIISFFVLFTFSFSGTADEKKDSGISGTDIKSARDFVVKEYDKLLAQDIGSPYFVDSLTNDIKKLKVKNNKAQKKGDSGCPDWRIFEAGNAGIESYRIGSGSKINEHVIIPVHIALNKDPILSQKELEKPSLYLLLIKSEQQWKIDEINYGSNISKPKFTLKETIKACLKE